MFYGIHPLHQAEVENGILAEKEGRSICLVLDAIRFLVGNVLLQDPEIQSGLQDLENLRKQGPRGLLKINHLMEVAWSHWTDERPFDPPEIKSVYELLLQFFEDLPTANGCKMQDMPDEFLRASISLKHVTAVGGWHIRIHGAFWIVGCNENDGGTFLVSEANRQVVYKVWGVRNSLIQTVEPLFGLQPILTRLTMVPWYGRLIYDGVVVPAHGKPGLPDKANLTLHAELQNSVKNAQEEGRIVEKITQLELSGAEITVSRPRKAAHSTFTLVGHPLAPPTQTEVEFLVKLDEHQGSCDKHTAWCLRRKGYTEHENPMHMGVIINAVDGLLVGTFSCSSLTPTASDVFKALLNATLSEDAELPALVLIDDLACFERVQFLLTKYTQKCSIRVQYYRPPSKV